MIAAMLSNYLLHPGHHVIGYLVERGESKTVRVGRVGKDAEDGGEGGGEKEGVIRGKRRERLRAYGQGWNPDFGKKPELSFAT